MPEGLEITGPTGTVELLVTDRITRILGEVALTGNTAGSVTNAGLSTGTPFAWASKDDGAFFAKDPAWSVSGNVLSWTWPYSQGGAFTLVYGVY